MTIEVRATSSFGSRTVQSPRRHGVMRTVALAAPRSFGLPSHVGALESSITCHQENHATTISGTSRRKTRRKRTKRNRKAVRCRMPWTMAWQRVWNRRNGLEGNRKTRRGAWFGGFWSLANGILERRKKHSAMAELAHGRRFGKLWSLANGTLDRPKK